jgi:hypothetical protein
MPTTYMAQNIAERERLRALVARLSEADLSREVEHGWTVATVLVHLAFWDRQRLLTLKRWLQDGQLPASGDYDLINDALAIISQAIPPRAAALLAVAAAEAIDYALEQLTPEQEAALESAGMTRLLNRSLHRRDHLEEIERALA